MEDLNQAFKRLQTKEASLTETVVSYVGAIRKALEAAILEIENREVHQGTQILRVTVSNIKQFERKVRPFVSKH